MQEDISLTAATVNITFNSVQSSQLEQWRTEGVWGVQTPPLEMPKAFQNHAKLNLIVETVKNC
jgi:hypothetical protein